MAINARLTVIAGELWTVWHGMQREQQYNKTEYREGTVMRYFFTLACAEPALSFRIVMLATAC